MRGRLRQLGENIAIRIGEQIIRWPRSARKWKAEVCYTCRYLSMLSEDLVDSGWSADESAGAPA